MRRTSRTLVGLWLAVVISSSGCGVVKVVEPDETAAPDGSVTTNFDFEQGDDITGVPNEPWFTTSSGYDYAADDEVAATPGGRSIRISSTPAADHEYGDLSMGVQTNSYSGRTLIFRGKIRTQEVVGAKSDPAGCTECVGDGATLQIGRVAGTGKTARLSPMVSGTTDWKEFEVRTPINEDPPETSSVSEAAFNYRLLAIVLFGRGVAWFDELRVETE